MVYRWLRCVDLYIYFPLCFVLAYEDRRLPDLHRDDKSLTLSWNYSCGRAPIRSDFVYVLLPSKAPSFNSETCSCYFAKFNKIQE